MGLHLIIENPNLEDEFEYILEEQNRNTVPELYIKGPYMLAESVNRNKRLYPIEEMRREVARYKTDMIDTKRAMGELNHPASADVDLERACHIVQDIWEEKEGSSYIFYGKSKVLSTPCGQICRNLINDGVKIGVSSRALGQLVAESDHNRVDKMRLVAIDTVADPSFPKAFVNGILESKEWILNRDGGFEETYDNFTNAIASLPRRDVDMYLREQVIKFIKKIS